MKFFDILHRRAVDSPDKVFWEDKECGYTFSETENITGRIYHYLKENHIGKEDIVAIRLPRSGKIPLAMLGVWKAGAAFVVIGEHTPKELADYQLEETKPVLIFTEKEFEESMKCDFTEGYENAAEHDLACVVYSTGSSGVFKGSMHEYGAIEKGVRRTYGYCEFYGLSEMELDEYRVILSAGFYTMNAVFSLVDSLILGYYQYILPYEDTENIEAIKRVLTEKKINSYTATSRDYKAIKELDSPYLKELAVAMDMISCTYDKGRPSYNYYGMSETICLLTCFKIDKSYDITPIGKPYKDIAMRIADKNGNTAADGEIGEICFVPEFWRGYINHPEKTEKVFYDGWFHTGDMGYINEDGNYVVVGRKIDIAQTEKGYIVPVFIATAFEKAFPKAEKCHVQIFEGKSAPTVCLYYCGKEEYSLEEVREKLGRYLDEYCLPTHCKRMEKFIYYPAGKLNRNTFLNPEGEK